MNFSKCIFSLNVKISKLTDENVVNLNIITRFVIEMAWGSIGGNNRVIKKKVRYSKNGKIIIQLNDIISQFPDQYRDILWLSLKGVEPDSIAEQLSLSEITVRRRQRTAGLYIRKHLDHALDIAVGLLLYQK